MDYNVYAWLARASYCKDSSGLIFDFEAKAKANLSAINEKYNELIGWKVIYADKALLGFQGVCRLGETQQIN